MKVLSSYLPCLTSACRAGCPTSSTLRQQSSASTIIHLSLFVRYYFILHLVYALIDSHSLPFETAVGVLLILQTSTFQVRIHSPETQIASTCRYCQAALSLTTHQPLHSTFAHTFHIQRVHPFPHKTSSLAVPAYRYNHTLQCLQVPTSADRAPDQC